MQRRIREYTQRRWPLLLWADSNDPSAMMRQGMYDENDNYLFYGESVSSVLTKQITVDSNSVSLRDYNLEWTWAEVYLPGVRDDLNLDSPESEPVADGGNTGDGALNKGGAFTGFFPNNNKREYQIIFDQGNSTDYSLKYREQGSEEWIPDDTGATDEDGVFTAAKCFILKHWWSGTPDPGDEFTFDAYPDCNTIEMPVIFHYKPHYFGGAVAYTVDHVNCLVDANTVFFGDSYGPVIEDPNTGAEGANDILLDYVKNLFEKAGYADVNDADSRYYHHGSGDIHCGTNVQRTRPTYKWWE